MTSPRRILDKVGALDPMDATSARVTSQSGIHYAPDIEIPPNTHWDIPPPVIEVSLRPGLEDLRGVTFGRFSVFGLSGIHQKRKRWIVRCACGAYEARTAKQIRCAQSNNDMCQKCKAWIDIKRRYELKGPIPVFEFARLDRKVELKRGDTQLNDLPVEVPLGRMPRPSPQPRQADGAQRGRRRPGHAGMRIPLRPPSDPKTFLLNFCRWAFAVEPVYSEMVGNVTKVSVTTKYASFKIEVGGDPRRRIREVSAAIALLKQLRSSYPRFAE